MFFGSLFYVAVKHGSGIELSSIYGIGTALPVLGFAILMAISVRLVSKAYNKLSVFETWDIRITAVIFVIVGGYYCVTYLC